MFAAIQILPKEGQMPIPTEISGVPRPFWRTHESVGRDYCFSMICAQTKSLELIVVAGDKPSLMGGKLASSPKIKLATNCTAQTLNWLEESIALALKEAWRTFQAGARNWQHLHGKTTRLEGCHSQVLQGMNSAFHQWRGSRPRVGEPCFLWHFETSDTWWLGSTDRSGTKEGWKV